MPKTIALVGALDTKRSEFAFVKAAIEARGHRTLVIDTGVVGEPVGEPAFADVQASRVAAAGGSSLAELRQKADRGAAMDVMARGVAQVARELYDQGLIDGVLSMGGSAGTLIGTSAMRALPVGVPKVMVSTLASGDTKAYVGTSDITMIHSVVDVAGVNRLSGRIYANAAGAVVGMVETRPPDVSDKPLLGASMFGNTTPVVDRSRHIMEDHGYEVLVFHATGTGGQTLESLVADGYITGLLEITTTEWADELTGGVLSAGPERMDAAGARGIPQVIAPGCLDMANFWARDTVPERYAGRLFYQWNPNVTLMRTTPEENAELGRILAEKANRSTGPVAFFLPLKGVSMLDAPGKEFWWPEADQALYAAVKTHVRPGIAVYELDCNINDDAFAEAVTAKLLEFLREPA